MVKGLRTRLNSEVDVVSIGSGAYRDLKETLTSALRHVVGYMGCVYYQFMCNFIEMCIGTRPRKGWESACQD